MVDLSKLEAGDSVVFADDEKAVVSSIRKDVAICGVRNSGTMTTFFLSFFDEKYKTTHNEFFDNGDSHWFSNKKIVEIIKNPKWSDEDMKEAFHHWQSRKTTDDDFYKWLEKYKANRNG